MESNSNRQGKYILVCIYSRVYAYTVSSYTLHVQWVEGGNLCDRSLTSCDTTSLESNWLVTQYILRNSTVSYPLQITVELLANTMQSCLESATCNSGRVGVYYYPSNGAVGNNEQLTTNNYVLIETTALTAIPGIRSFSFSLEATYDRFYIAVVDQGYCVTLRQLRVYYSACIADMLNNVIYPATPVGNAGVPAVASCSGSFAPSPGSSLDLFNLR